MDRLQDNYVRRVGRNSTHQHNNHTPDQEKDARNVSNGQSHPSERTWRRNDHHEVKILFSANGVGVDAIEPRKQPVLDRLKQ